MNAQVYVRRDIWSLQPDDPIVTAYAGAVARMKEREAETPTSWIYQAGIHGTPRGTPPRPDWNECQHGTWFFLPWHRMFLYYFERIVRAAVIELGGPAGWALPYWNYGEGGRHATLPLAFRDPQLANGEPNPLYIEQRGQGINEGTLAIPEGVGSPKEALACKGFIGKAEFGGIVTGPNHFAKGGRGELEETPHNVVHGFIGGLMGDPDTAANDPIFWLHHANIDRLWSKWIGMPNANHQDPAEAAWLNEEWSFFDADGSKAKLRSEQVLATIPDLGYSYDIEEQPPVPAPPPEPVHPLAAAVNPPHRELIGATQHETVLTGEPVTLPIAIADHDAQPFEPPVRAYLNVEEVAGERNPGTAYAVYVALDPEQPVAEQSARRVGNLAFFGIERASDPGGDEAPHALESSYEITAVARQLQEHGDWSGHEVPVTFMPVTLVPAPGAAADVQAPSPAHAEDPVRIGRVSVFYDA